MFKKSLIALSVVLGASQITACSSSDDDNTVENSAPTAISLSATSVNENAAGAAIGATYETMRRELRDPVPAPPPEEVKGLGPRIGRAVHKARYKGDQWSRRHPVAATMASAAAGAAAGGMTRLGSGARELNKTRKGKI